jgi:hypothetical protein
MKTERRTLGRDVRERRLPLAPEFREQPHEQQRLVRCSVRRNGFVVPAVNEKAAVSGFFGVGRAGFEPAALELEVPGFRDFLDCEKGLAPEAELIRRRVQGGAAGAG